MSAEAAQIQETQFTAIQALQSLYVPIAATVAETCTHPIDFVKTQTQIRKNSYFSCAKETLATHGVVGFYPSLLPAVARHWVYTSCRIGIYEQISGGSVGWKAAAAFTAGALSQFIANPMDLVKIQIIDNPKLSVREAVSTTFRSSGLKGFYTGWQPNVARSCFCNLAELVTYDMSKNFLINKLKFCDSTCAHFVSALMSGLAATLASTPADFIKSNYMSHPEKYNYSLGRCVVSLVKERGILVLWRGSVFNFLRLGPWQTIFWVTYERLKKLHD